MASTTRKAASARPTSPAASPKKAIGQKTASARKAVPARKTGPSTSAAAPVAPKEVKPKKPKLVRDSFTMPKDEYAALDALKLRAAKLARPAKKSEVLRAGVKALTALSDAAFLAALEVVPAIKTGRPKKA